MADNNALETIFSNRFRGYYPVVVDVETGGVNPRTDALLEIAAIPIILNEDNEFTPGQPIHQNVTPFKNANLDPDSLAFNKIDPYHPFRFDIDEKQALTEIFKSLRQHQKQAGCKRCVLVGHNAWFDLHFLKAATLRANIKRSPFHPFTCFDTATLAAVFYGHTVLAETLKLAKIPYDASKSHSALYDAEITAQLFCKILNDYPFNP